MSKIAQLKIFLFCLTLLCGTASAETISWPSAVEITTKNNAELRGARADFDSTQALENSAKSGYLPVVTGTLSATKSNTPVVSGSGAVVGGNRTATTYSATLSASENIFNGLADLGRTQQAEANTRVAAATLQTVRAKASRDLKANFESLTYSKESVRLTSEILKRREDNLRLVELRFESGRENKGSVLLSRAYLNQARYENLQAKNAVSRARVDLAKTLGIDDESTLDVTGEVPLDPPPSADLAWTKLASETPDHVKSAAQEDAAMAATTIARSGFFPTLGLTGSAGRQGDRFFPEDHRWSVGLNLTFPLFSGFKDYANLKSAIASRVSSLESRVSVDRDLLVRLKQARNDFEEAFEKLKVDESFRDAAQTRAEIARNKYNNGLQTFDDWDIIESDLINRQKVALASKQNRVVNEAAWEQVQGKGILP
ncbi:MAG: TolC family protein [Cryobacterium sp.]|nr:TolC family protein [Oligoflexia bacterium]